jgi:hypothetical protein
LNSLLFALLPSIGGGIPPSCLRLSQSDLVNASHPLQLPILELNGTLKL